MGSEVDEGAEAGTFGVDLDSTEFHKQSGDGDFWILTPSSGSLAGRGVLSLPVERFDGALLIAVPATAWGARVAKRCLTQAQTLKAMTVEVEVEVEPGEEDEADDEEGEEVVKEVTSAAKATLKVTFIICHTEVANLCELSTAESAVDFDFEIDGRAVALRRESLLAVAETTIKAEEFVSALSSGGRGKRPQKVLKPSVKPAAAPSKEQLEAKLEGITRPHFG